MSDPFGSLLDELLDAHDGLSSRQHEHGDRQAPGDGPDRTPRAAGRRWRLTILVGLGMIASISVAAAVVVETRISAPLSGRLPRQLLGVRYDLQVGPDLVAGQAAWCATLSGLESSRPLSLGPERCETPQGAVIAKGGLVAVSSDTGSVSGWLLYAVVDRRVAALQAPDGTRVIPIHRPQLPYDWTAAVTIQSNPEKLHGHSRVALSPLSPRDTPLRGAASLEPAQATQLPVQPADPLRPPSHGCAIDARAMPGIRLRHAWAFRGVVPTRVAVTQPGFLSCYSLTFDIDGRQGVAAILLDARHPGRTPDGLPNTRALPGAAGVVSGPAAENLGFGFAAGDRLIAKRIHGGWLVLQTAATSVLGSDGLRYFRAHT
jgi:hypothetical protein